MLVKRHKQGNLIITSSKKACLIVKTGLEIKHGTDH